MAAIAALLADPARSRMLMALMSGLALTATELAMEAGVAPSTASAHLAKLEARGLIALERQGRHRYFRLASAEVAAFVETLAGFSATRGTTRRFGPRDPAHRLARICYDHLAGERAVWLLDRLRERGYLGGHDGLALTREGDQLCERLGIDLDSLRHARRPLTRACLDWSERRHHLGGALGAAILARLLELGWCQRDLVGRGVAISRLGEASLLKLLS